MKSQAKEFISNLPNLMIPNFCTKYKTEQYLQDSHRMVALIVFFFEKKNCNFKKKPIYFGVFVSASFKKYMHKTSYSILKPILEDLEVQ